MYLFTLLFQQCQSHYNLTINTLEASIAHFLVNAKQQHTITTMKLEIEKYASINQITKYL